MKEFEVTVMDKREALEFARDRLADLLELLSQQNLSKKDRASDVRKRTRNIKNVLARAMKALDAGNKHQSSGQLEVAKPQAIALPDDLSRNADGPGRSGKSSGSKEGKNDSSQSVDDTMREQAFPQLESVVELISFARSAEV